MKRAWLAAVVVLGMMGATGAAPAQLPAGPVVPGADMFAGKPRVVVISDIGNEPDDQMSFVRLLLYSNQMDLEAMVASTSTWQKTATHPETMHAIAKVYGQVRPNLLLHDKGWPTAEELDARIYAGQPGYGMADTGPGRETAGSAAVARAIEKEDARPLWICLWGGVNTLAQALMDLRGKHSAAEMDAMVGRLRVSSISDQDDAGPWIRREFPELEYVVKPSMPNSNDYQAATWTGISGDMYYRNGLGADSSLVTNEWLETHIRAKGPLGKMYPKFMFIMEGDTPSYLGLIDNGLNAYRRPDWGGWGGRYVWLQPYGETHAMWSQGGDEFFRANSQDRVKGLDGQFYVTDQATVWRWREAFQNDFAARMEWTIADYAHANHAPAVMVNGVGGTAPVEVTVEAGGKLVLDAKGTKDPDGQPVHLKWWVYEEAGLSGTQGATLEIASPEAERTEVVAKSPCREPWLAGLIPCRGDGVAHVILEVTDAGTPKLTSYRRVVVHVKAAAAVAGKP